DQVGRDPPSSVRQLADQPIRPETFQSTEISLYEFGRRQGARAGRRVLLGFELPLMLARGIHTAIFFGDLSDGLIGGLQPILSLEGHSDLFAPRQALPDLG